jgi:hypothetical protein
VFQAASNCRSKRFSAKCKGKPGDLSVVLQAFERLVLQQTEVDVLANFSEFWAQRILLHTDESFSLVLMCWLPKQTAVLEAEHESYARILSGELVGLACETAWIFINYRMQPRAPHPGQNTNFQRNCDLRDFASLILTKDLRCQW